MNYFPETICSKPQTDQSVQIVLNVESTYVNCNICRNFCNILELSHRKSKEHQKKMSEKFRVIRSQIKKLGQNSVLVHDEEWKKNDSLYCYFCDKSVLKHKVNDGVMVESFGYITHLSKYEHEKAVKFYLKYHQRKENFEIFCKTEGELNKFVEKLSEAKKIYLRKMEVLNAKDVQFILNVEEYRKKVYKKVLLTTTANIKTDVLASQSSSMNVVQKFNKKSVIHKVPPWHTTNMEKKACTEQAQSLIGPTMETLVQHVSTQRKKNLPVKRLNGNIKYMK